MSIYPDVETALYSKLSGTAALTALVGTTTPRIYNPQAPANTTLPYCIFYLASGLMPNQSPRLDINNVYRIEGVGSTRAQAEDVFEAVFTALHLQTLSLTGWGVYWMVLESARSMVENVDGTQYFRRIAEIRIKADKS